MPQKLKKTGTMQQVTREGESYLERTWGPEKLKTARAFGAIFSDTNTMPSTSNSQDDIEPPTKRPKLAKHTTMMNTAKESEALLKDTNIDTDAKTRHQANEISKLIPVKTTKPQLKKTKTMAATTKESETILKSANIDGDAKTRNQSKVINSITQSPAKLKKHSTMTATTQAALDFITRQPLGATRAVKGTLKNDERKTKPKKVRTKKAAPTPKKPTLKKARTMERTAKEGKAFVKRLNKKSK